MQLVEKFETSHWAACGPVMLPLRVDTAWGQPTKPHSTGVIAIPPGQAAQIGRIVFRLSDLDGKVLAEFPAEREVFQAEGQFIRAIARWPVAIATPGAHHVTAIVFDHEWNQLARIAPRLTSVNWEIGY